MWPMWEVKGGGSLPFLIPYLFSNSTLECGRYYHVSIEWRAIIWRAVSNEKSIIVKNISNFRNYF